MYSINVIVLILIFQTSLRTHIFTQQLYPDTQKASSLQDLNLHLSDLYWNSIKHFYFFFHCSTIHLTWNSINASFECPWGNKITLLQPDGHCEKNNHNNNHLEMCTASGFTGWTKAFLYYKGLQHLPQDIFVILFRKSHVHPFSWSSYMLFRCEYLIWTSRTFLKPHLLSRNLISVVSTTESIRISQKLSHILK